MSLQQIIDCTPWRLNSPRFLTPYEWTIVEKTVHDSIVGITRELYSTSTKARAVALTRAISLQTACDSWHQSQFGPEPAVAGYAYGCLASWWAGFDPATQAKVLIDIQNGLLCTQNPPWGMCPRSAIDVNWQRSVRSEYEAQQGDLSSVPLPPCAYLRTRISYMPMTGEEMIAMMKAVGGGVLSPELAQMVQTGGTMFANRSFIVGFETKQQIDWSKMPQSLSTMADMMLMVDAMMEDIALIWAPGRGISIRQMLVTGRPDPAQLMILIQGLMPDVLGGLLQSLPQIFQTQLPTFLNQPLRPGADASSFLSSSRINRMYHLGPLTVTPYTPPISGLQVVDKPRSEQNTSPPAGLTIQQSAMATKDVAVWIAVSAVVFGIALILRGRSES